MITSGQAINLNAAQRAAVEHLHGPLLVIAGAGTGKTRVIVERIAYLFDTIPDLEGENILALTFSRKAAAEMAARIQARGDERAERVGVFTFHGFCYELLRSHDEAVTILEDVDYWIFLRRRIDQLGLDLFRKLSEPGRFLSAFREFFSRCQDELVSPENYHRYVADLADVFEREKGQLNEDERNEREEEVRRQQEIARAYVAAERLLREAKRTTFGGSLLAAVQLLQSKPELLAGYQNRLRYILVDEYQDANIAQITLLRLLTGTHRNLMAVGDDDQAIYRFRGASYASFQKFAELFPDHKKISLTQNYRSTSRILRVAGQLIAQNGPARFDLHKKLTATKPAGDKVKLSEVEDVGDEAAFVRSEIERLRPAAGTFGAFAVLYRAHAHRAALVEELSRAGIPFVIRGLSVLPSTLLRDLIAYLRAIDSPRDNISLIRLLTIPAWKLTPDMLLDLVERSRRERSTVVEAIEGLHPEVRHQQTRLGELLQLLSDFRARAHAVNATELLDELLERLALRLLPSDPDRPYLDCFANFLRQWEKEKSETKHLAEFVEYFDYYLEAGGTVNLPEDSDKQDAVQLMTVHAAKGLEFDSVFVLRLNRNDFPTTRRRPLFTFPDALMKEALPPGDVHVQEERRLAYVALTRGRNRLTLTSLSGGRKKPSVFLEDILRDPQAAREVTQIESTPSPANKALEESAPGGSRQASLFAARQASACYSRMADWAVNELGPALTEPLSLSHSAIETYKQCPLKYKLGHHWHLPGASTPAMVFGQIMHRTVVESFRARQRRPDLPLDELQHIYEQQWRQTRWPFRDNYQQDGYRSAGWQQLQVFHQRHAGQAVAVLELEKTFQWQWEDVVLTGRIDQINQTGKRKVEIIEYKTGEPRLGAGVEKSLQLALYSLATQHHLGLIPERLTLYNLTVNQSVSFAPAEKHTARALDDVRDVAARIRAHEFPARPGYHCRYCDYRLLCPAHEDRIRSPANGHSATNETEETN